jgi:UPF0755 protein
MTQADEPVFDTPRRPWTFYRILATAVLFGLATLLLAGVAGGVVAFVVYDHVTQPGVAGPEVEVVVPQKATGRDVGRILAEGGLIEHETFFRLALQIDGTNQPLRSGAYRLHRGNSALELLRELYKGPSRQVVEAQFKVTVPEGLTIRQASELVKDPQGFIDAARDQALIRRLGIEAESLEGFLMPNTYFFDAEPEARVLVERMVAQFEKEYKKLAAQVPGAAKLNRMRIVTIASLVEEETKVDEERSLVARVVYNRIDKKMPLQLDSTLQFVLNKYGQRLLYEDREVDSPYNTYIRNGLPPGPISSPGAASLRAALRPADTKNIYFVSNADGRTHTFSNTEEEHVKAVAKFRREIGPQREALEKQRQQEQQAPPATPSGGAPIIPATPTDESP